MNVIIVSKFLKSPKKLSFGNPKVAGACAGLLVAAMLLTYLALSPWGLVEEAAPKQIDWAFVVGGIALAALIFGVPRRAQSRGAAKHVAVPEEPCPARPSD